MPRKNKQRRVVLASNSPRRKELLDQIGLKFTTIASNISEDIKITSPISFVKHLSIKKAKFVSRKEEDAVIIGADTIVVLKNEIIGKPKSLEDAINILKKLSGRTHLVITGFTVLDSKTKKSITKAVKTKVVFKKLTTEEIEEYVYSSSVLDKAGAYAIQEKSAVFIKEIEGDYFNIVGLPIFSLYHELKKFGINITENW